MVVWGKALGQGAGKGWHTGGEGFLGSGRGGCGGEWGCKFAWAGVSVPESPAVKAPQAASECLAMAWQPVDLRDGPAGGASLPGS